MRNMGAQYVPKDGGGPRQCPPGSLGIDFAHMLRYVHICSPVRSVYRSPVISFHPEVLWIVFLPSGAEPFPVGVWEGRGHSGPRIEGLRPRMLKNKTNLDGRRAK